MRHKWLCHLHDGNIAKCTKCIILFSANEIIANALNIHLGKHTNKVFSFPDGVVKHLDRIVYEMQKDFAWMEKDDKSKALRYFASNALTNVHLISHATRCFKKGPECYANLPEAVSESVKIVYNEERDLWSDYYGRKEFRYMFWLQPHRSVEDAFVNIHNPTITTLLGCNNNVMVGMNGQLVLYVTGYNVKSQQKEERVAYEKVSELLVKIFSKSGKFIPSHHIWICVVLTHNICFSSNRKMQRNPFQSNNWDSVGCWQAFTPTQVGT